MANVSTKNLTRHTKVPRFPYAAITERLLPGWDISLVFVTPARAKALNRQLRNKTYIPNVLSYTVGEKSGEIIICLAEARKQAPSYDMRYGIFCLYLFIHGLLHLKGWAHGGTMEQCERKLLADFAKNVVRTH